MFSLEMKTHRLESNTYFVLLHAVSNRVLIGCVNPENIYSYGTY